MNKIDCDGEAVEFYKMANVSKPLNIEELLGAPNPLNNNLESTESLLEIL